MPLNGNQIGRQIHPFSIQEAALNRLFVSGDLKPFMPEHALQANGGASPAAERASFAASFVQAGRAMALKETARLIE